MTHSQIEFDINNCLDILSKYVGSGDQNKDTIAVKKDDLRNLKNNLNEIRSQLMILKEY